jgi:hypothetical protein
MGFLKSLLGKAVDNRLERFNDFFRAAVYAFVLTGDGAAYFAAFVAGVVNEGPGRRSFINYLKSFAADLEYGKDPISLLLQDDARRFAAEKLRILADQIGTKDWEYPNDVVVMKRKLKEMSPLYLRGLEQYDPAVFRRHPAMVAVWDKIMY